MADWVTKDEKGEEEIEDSTYIRHANTLITQKN